VGDEQEDGRCGVNVLTGYLNCGLTVRSYSNTDSPNVSYGLVNVVSCPANSVKWRFH
jgi:hypothetical protein